MYIHSSEVIYFCSRIFFHSILSIFFKSIDVVGVDNIPLEGSINDKSWFTGIIYCIGPVLFTGNHANQFVDGVIVMMNCVRKVGFLVAEKSFKRPIIGDFSRAIGCIPTIRPQDSVKLGSGKVSIEKEDDVWYLMGKSTAFTKELDVGYQVRVQGDTVAESGGPVKIVEVISDIKAIVKDELKAADGSALIGDTVYGIYEKVDQSDTFSAVYTSLKHGNCIGIFPEGGSHDRTDLLPLKAGVAIMAFGARQKYDINVPIVPVGLNYFRGHRFRGRVVVEFGTPIQVNDAAMATYKQNKYEATDSLLAKIEEGMRSVIVTAPDYNTLQAVYTARRLYQPSGIRLSPRKTQDLNRRFAEGVKRLTHRAEIAEEGTPEASIATDMEQLREKLDAYSANLHKMGLQDRQVQYIGWWGLHDLVGAAVYGSLIFLLASIPTLFLNAPVGLLARYFANVEKKKALAGSKVKITGRDVMLSKKILFSVVAVPSLWIFYLFLACTCTNWYWSSIVLVFWCFPLFSFFGVRAVEAGIIEYKNILPLFYRLLPSHRALQDKLPIERSKLQADVRAFIAKYDHVLGELTSPKRINWSEYMHDYPRCDSGGDLASRGSESTSRASDCKKKQ